jgi:hypothetical protein
MTPPRRAFRILFLCFVLLAAGCAREPLTELKIHAESPIRFAMWRVDVSDRLNREQWRLFDQAMQERKFRIMQNGAASGSAGVDEALMSEIDGKLLYDMVQPSLQARLNRLTLEKAELEARIAANTRLKTREGDYDSAQVLRDTIATQTLRARKLDYQIADAIDDLNLLEKTFHPER